MPALSQCTPVRPQPIVTETFEAMRLREDGELRRIATQPSFEECRDHALQVSLHGEKFAVRRTNVETGRVALHLFQVKRRGQAIWVHEGAGTRRVQPMYADELAVVRL